MGFDIRFWLDMSAKLPRAELRAALIQIADREEMVIISREAFSRLIDAQEDIKDIDAFERFERRLAAGEEELLPAAMVDRMIDGENPVRVWREYRGLSGTALAEKAGISPSYLSEIENSSKPGSVAAMKALAMALGVSMDDLV